MGRNIDFGNFNEVRNVAFSLGVTELQLKEAAKVIGADIDKIREYFKSYKVPFMNRNEPRVGLLFKYRRGGK